MDVEIPLGEGNFYSCFLQFFEDCEIKLAANLPAGDLSDINPDKQLEINRTVPIFYKIDLGFS